MFPKDDERDWSFNMAFKSVVHSLGNDIRRGTLGTHGNERFAFEVSDTLSHCSTASQCILVRYSYCTVTRLRSQCACHH
jgi:hypothetical protein